MRFKPCLSPDDVIAIAAACKAEGERIGRQGPVAIVDAGGVLLYRERPEHNPVIAVDMAWMKARTAAVRARASATFEERVKTRPGFLMVPHTLAIEGGDDHGTPGLRKFRDIPGLVIGIAVIEIGIVTEHLDAQPREATQMAVERQAGELFDADHALTRAIHVLRL